MTKVYHICNKNLHEYSDTMKLILKYVNDNEAKLGSCLFPMKEIIGSLQESRSYLANCYHTHIFDNYHTTQSPTESMNIAGYFRGGIEFTMDW